MKRNKKKLLQAMQNVLRQYQNGVHEIKHNNCPLCLLYFEDEILDYSKCSKCPMNIFSPKEGYGCLDRNTKPVHQLFYCYSDLNTKRVIEFYRKVIEAIKALTPEELNRTRFAFLKKIDREIINNS